VETGSTAVKAGEEVLIFIKHYDPRASKLTLISRLLLHPSTMLSRLAERLADKLHLPRDSTKVCG
jgi:ICP0-binding domain of Ubiquitin-specific protease 7